MTDRYESSSPDQEAPLDASYFDVPFFELTPEQQASVLKQAIEKAMSDEGIEVPPITEDMDSFAALVPKDPEGITNYPLFRDALREMLSPEYDIFEQGNRLYIREVSSNF